jgi:hypothetical protein
MVWPVPRSFKQLVEEIALLPVPQVVMRINDRPLGLDRRLDEAL